MWNKHSVNVHHIDTRKSKQNCISLPADKNKQASKQTIKNLKQEPYQVTLTITAKKIMLPNTKDLKLKKGEQLSVLRT